MRVTARLLLYFVLLLVLIAYHAEAGLRRRRGRHSVKGSKKSSGKGGSAKHKKQKSSHHSKRSTKGPKLVKESSSKSGKKKSSKSSSSKSSSSYYSDSEDTYSFEEYKEEREREQEQDAVSDDNQDDNAVVVSDDGGDESGAEDNAVVPDESDNNADESDNDAEDDQPIEDDSENILEGRVDEIEDDGAEIVIADETVEGDADDVGEVDADQDTDEVAQDDTNQDTDEVVQDDVDQDTDGVAQDDADQDTDGVAQDDADQDTDEDTDGVAQDDADQDTDEVVQDDADQDTDELVQDDADQDTDELVQDDADQDTDELVQDDADQDTDELVQDDADQDTDELVQDDADQDTDELVQDDADQVAPDQAAVEDMIKFVMNSVGGESSLLSLSQFQMDATGKSFIDFETNQPKLLVPAERYTRIYYQDLNKQKLRVDSISSSSFESFASLDPIEYSRIINGQVGALTAQYFFASPGPLPSGNVASLTRQQMLFNPAILLKSFLDNLDDISFAGATDSRNMFVFPSSVSDILLFTDIVTGYPTKLETFESHPLLGDTKIVVHFRQWNLHATTDSGHSISFPRTVTLYGEDGMLWEEERSNLILNPSIPDGFFDLPADTPTDVDPIGFQFGLASHHLLESFFGAGFPYPYLPPIPLVDTLEPYTELAPGIFFVSSVTNSLLVEYSNGIILVEAPSSSQHAKKLINFANEIAPSKDLTFMLQSHHHVDHAGGVRTVVLTGADLVVGNGVKDFWAEVLLREFTIDSDGAGSTDSAGSVIEVDSDASLDVINESNLIVTVHHTSRIPHAQDMTMITIENQDSLFIYQADLYNLRLGVTIVDDGPKYLFDALREKGIVDSSCKSEFENTFIVPAHGFVATLDDAIAELSSLNIDVGC